MKVISYVFLFFGSFVQIFAQQNPSFEGIVDTSRTAPMYWYVGGKGYDIKVDSTTAYEGIRSLCMRRVEPGSFGVARQTISADSIVGGNFVLSGWIKTHDVSDGYAGLWVRLDGAYHEIILDNMGDRGITGTTPWTRYEIKTSVSSDVRQITFGALLTGNGTAWFDSFEIKSPFTQHLPPPSPEAISYIDEALGIMEANSMKRDSIDWKSLRNSIITRSRGAVHLKDTYLQIRYALALLGDHHSFFMSPEEVQSWEHGVGRSGTSAFVLSEIINARFAYVSIPAFATGNDSAIRAFATQIQRTISNLDSTNPCGWIVDLRNDDGGDMWPMIAGLGPLLGEKQLGKFVDLHGNARSWRYTGGKADLDSITVTSVIGVDYTLRSANPPIAVLIGNNTASSGEAVVVSFRARPNTRSFGSGTRGLSTENQNFRLSDGAMMLLTTSAFADRTGKLYGGVIQPDEFIDTERSTDLSTDPVVQAAVSWLKAQNSCYEK